MQVSWNGAGGRGSTFNVAGPVAPPVDPTWISSVSPTARPNTSTCPCSPQRSSFAPMQTAPQSAPAYTARCVLYGAPQVVMRWSPATSAVQTKKTSASSVCVGQPPACPWNPLVVAKDVSYG